MAALRRARQVAAAGASQAPLPADNRELLVDDLASSGLVWGRAGSVWWELSGRATSSDPRAAQGLVAVKLNDASGWHDLLALRPIHGKASSTWTLTYADGTVATPTFTGVHGTGRKVLLLGRYRRAGGRVLGRVSWTLSTTATGDRAGHEHARQDDAAHDRLANPGAPAPRRPRRHDHTRILHRDRLGRRLPGDDLLARPAHGDARNRAS